ncbi:E3 ubiquitin ligase BIG BROTHER-related [Acorus gramineus]|uniref:RING-type E3 ubiquitin transferase n=1 Tax=Acorus gramineus TaxID=55184 RepID=A0AAV9AMY1_ACOGR|nr:E3 ubiquitin ligase BIG BROTHER-related [Acorus gramineus]
MDGDLNWGQPNPESHTHSGTSITDSGNLIFPPDYIPLTGGNLSHSSLIQSMDDYSTTFEPVIPNYMDNPPPIIYDTSVLHPASNGSIGQIHPSYDHRGSSSSSQHQQAVHGDEDNMVNIPMDHTRVTSKRKSPVIHEEGNSSGNHAAGSSSNNFVLSDPLQQGNNDTQSLMWNPLTAAPNYRGSSLIIGGEASQRNVRIRHTNNLEENQAGAQASNSLPHQFHTIGSSANNSGNVAQPDPSVNFFTGQGSQLPALALHRDITPPASGGDQSYIANQSLVDASVDMDAGYGNAIPGGNPGVTFPSLRSSFSQAMGRGHDQGTSFAIQMAQGYTASENPLENGMQSGFQHFASSARSRPLFISGSRNDDRSGRMRGVIIRSQSFSDEDNSHNRMMSQAFAMVDPFIYNSRSLYDQHRDMRLDVDNMSYEELLDLGERIGHVNTGLSDEMILKYLRMVIYCSSYESADDETCAICLENYNDLQDLGTLKCGHDYHFECIKKWLGMKNICPICKTEPVAFTESSKYK